MKFNLLIQLILMLSLSKELNTVAINQLIIWNVGQGQFITYSTPSYCWHFDIGGEYFPKKSVRLECSNKSNYVSFTHWDYDHIAFTQKLKYLSKNLCISHSPGGPVPKKKLKYLKNISSCKDNPKIVSELVFSIKNPKKPNNNSRIFILKNKVLITGDSPKEEELRWAKNKFFDKIKYLIAGHHGSKTSSSNYLLSKLKNLKLVLISSRKKRYGHPHSEVLIKFNRLNIPYLTTEKWGHIKIDLE